MEDKDKIAELQAKLDASEAEKNALAAKMATGDTRLPIAGSYKGYRFDDGHLRIRDKQGLLCGTAELLAAATAKTPDPLAVEVLDWLIEIQYAHFTKKKA